VTETRPANRLIGETSPYLLQHAYNPVDWYPWGEDALQRAREEDKPILLSVGYAACHWCHVMERESFEDEETARYLNEHFVPVKVDREERPDLDAIYMDAVQALTGSGGWPMTVFLAPDGTPFYAGTYFPKEERHGLPSFRRVLEAMAEAWREQRDRVTDQGRRVVARLAAASALQESADPLTEDLLRRAYANLQQIFDEDWGGFGGAPKFPQPVTLEFVLRAHLRGYEGALPMVEATLDAMANGGMYDQVGGGFHRYSTDARWHVPHFEKMLYDNALLARLYVRAWQVTGRDRYRRVATETLDYLLRELRHPDGAFFSSQDADSEGVEGKFFVWSWEQLVDVARRLAVLAAGRLDPREAADLAEKVPPEAVASFLGALPDGNWEGTNVLWTPRSIPEAAAAYDVDPARLARAVDHTRYVLLRLRNERVRPATDDKVLAAWNGLAIAAFAEAGRALQETRYVAAAEAAADFVLTRLRRPDARLLRSWREGRGGEPGFADDHAAMAEACLTLYETTFDVRWFGEARRLADDLLRLFRDPERGGFFQTGSDAPELVVRPKELFDHAVPSGNATAGLVLQRLYHLTAEPEYLSAGLSALRLVRDLMPDAPTGAGEALCALDLYLSQVREVAIVGEPADPATRGLIGQVHDRYLPNAVVAAAGPEDAVALGAIGLLADRVAVDGKATAYVCEGFTCRLPVTDPAELAAQLA
jgi:uncharacterized protein YyaL (SSP411 family)